MKQIERIRLNLNSSIKDALRIIDSGAIQIALVVDDSQKLIGTITDGDVRRGLLDGKTLDDDIESIIHTTPIVCSIYDSKETILEKAIENKVHQVPIINESGEVVGIEEVEELIKPKTHMNKVVLMAGGLGARLRPLTDDCPKPLLEVGSKPILETIIQNFSKYGFKNIILSVNYKSHMIENYFGDGSRFGVTIEYVHEEKKLGTAGALSLMKDKLDDTFFVMNGDLLTNINFEHMLNYHTSSHSIATMGVREYDFQIPYGVVKIENQRIIEIKEKPLQKYFVSGGVYILEPEALERLPENMYFDMPSLFEKLIQQNKPTLSFPIREYWLDIGRLRDFEQANNEYDSVFNFNLDD